MYTGIIVTQAGPCSVPKKLFAEIVSKKEAGDLGNQVLFALEFDLERVKLNIAKGDLEYVRSMAEFTKKFLSHGGPSGRSILIE